MLRGHVLLPAITATIPAGDASAYLQASKRLLREESRPVDGLLGGHFSFLLTHHLLYTYSDCSPDLLAYQEVRAEMEGPQADHEQTERLLFLSSQADDKFSVTINEFYASVRQQCQNTAALPVFANGSLSHSQSNRLAVASQEATKNLQDRMRALYSSFEEQKDAKAKALSALASEHGFFKLNNALLLSESHELIAQDNELQKLHRTTHSECEGLKKQVAGLDLERANLLDRATTAEKQQNVLQVEIDHKTRQYNQSQTSVLGLEGQVRQLDRSLLVDRAKLEDEKRRSAELQTSVEYLQSKVETLEQALSQSNDCLKVHVAHVDTQQTKNDALRRQVQDLESSIESARRELNDSKQETKEHQDAAMGLDLKMRELEQSFQSTKDRLENEKSLSNAGQASITTLTMKLHQLEDSLNTARQKGIDGNDRHDALQQNLERSLDLSNNSLETYMDRCKSQQASIDSLSDKAQRLESSLEVAQKALEDEGQQHAIRQATVGELETTAKQLEASLVFASDSLIDEKGRCSMYQASIVSLTAKVRNLEQSLHLAHMNLEKQKRNVRVSIVSAESNVQKLQKTLDLTRKDLEDKTMRCMAQEASMFELNEQTKDLKETVRVARGDAEEIKQRYNAQQASVIRSDELRQELEKSLQASRDDLEAEAQLYSSQQPYIDSLKDTERGLQRSLLESQTETQAEKDRCATQQSSIAQMERDLQELKVELVSTRGKLECAEQLGSARDDGVTDSGLNIHQLEDSNDCDTAAMDLVQGQSTPDESRRSEPMLSPTVSGAALASGEDNQFEAVTRLQSELAATTESLQLYQDVVRAITDHSLEHHMQLPCTTLTQNFSKLRGDLERATDVVRNCPALLKAQIETRYNFLVLKTILQQLLSDKNHRAKRTFANASGSDAIEVTSRFIGARYPQSGTTEMQNRGGMPSPILYEESCGESDCESDSSKDKYIHQYTKCQGRYVVKFRNRVCLNATQTERLRTFVRSSAEDAHWNARCPLWLKSISRVDYPGETEDKTLAGLSLIEQIVDSMLKPPHPQRRDGPMRKSCPPDPLRGLKVIKQRVALYWYECYATESARHASPADETAPHAISVRKRHNSEELDHESQRHSKRHAGLSVADAIEISNSSDTSSSESNFKADRDQRSRGFTTANAIDVDNASDTNPDQSDYKLEPDQWSIIDERNAVSMAMWTLKMHRQRKLKFLEYIQRSPWARHTCEGDQQFVKSLTTALNVNVISRLATLSSSYPVQQVLLQINLRQLDQMLAYLNGSYIIPLARTGFKITEVHIKSFSKLCFNKARLNQLLDYPLNRARFDRYNDDMTLGFRSSGRFKLVRRGDPPTAALTLRERFDTETIAAMRVSDVTGLDGTEDFEKEATDQNRDRHSGGAAEAQISRSEHASKDVHDNVANNEHLRNTAAISKVQQTVRSRRKNKSSQGTAGANGRPKRTPKPSRRASEAASAKRG